MNFTRTHGDKSHWLRENLLFKEKMWSWEFRNESNSLTEGVHLNEKDLATQTTQLDDMITNHAKSAAKAFGFQSNINC